MISTKKIKSPKTVDFLSTEFYQMLRPFENQKDENISRFLFMSPDNTSKIIATEIFTETMNSPVKPIFPGSIIGKYIGETEKNLSKLLSNAESHDTILYLEEADKLFEKRDKKEEEKAIYTTIFNTMDNYNCVTIFDLRKLKTAEKIKNHFDFVVRFPYLSTQVRKMFWKLKQIEALQSGENGDLKPAAEG